MNWTRKQIEDLYANSSKSFKECNGNASALDSVRTGEPQHRMAHAVGKAPARKVLAEGYRLGFVRIDFKAAHGKGIDCGGNLAAVDKPFLDAIVNLGLAVDDKEIKSHVAQGKDANFYDV